MLASHLHPIKYGFIALLVSYLLVFPDVRLDEYFTDEDSWVENLTALAYFMASILLFITYYRSKGNGVSLGKFRSTKNLVFLFLSVLFFVAFGEEISWGQRIFNWATPQKLAEVNYQGEFNIHNLQIFRFKGESDNSFLSWLLVLNPGRLFFYFWMLYMVIFPFMNTYSKKFKGLISHVNVPIPDLSMGLLMIANLVFAKMYKLFTRNLDGDFTGSLDEIQEGNYAVIILFLSIHLKKKYS